MCFRKIKKDKKRAEVQRLLSTYKSLYEDLSGLLGEDKQLEEEQNSIQIKRSNIAINLKTIQEKISITETSLKKYNITVEMIKKVDATIE